MFTIQKENNNYYATLISKYKKRLNKDEIKKTCKILFDLVKNDITCTQRFKINIIKSEEKKNGNLIIAPSYFKRYFEDFKKKNNSLPEKAGEDTPFTAESNEVNDMQPDSSDFENEDE